MRTFANERDTTKDAIGDFEDLDIQVQPNRTDNKFCCQSDRDRKGSCEPIGLLRNWRPFGIQAEPADRMILEL